MEDEKAILEIDQSRLIDEIDERYQVQTKKLVKNVKNLENKLESVELERTSNKVYSEFVQQLESLNNRIFSLEKKTHLKNSQISNTKHQKNQKKSIQEIHEEEKTAQKILINLKVLTNRLDEEKKGRSGLKYTHHILQQLKSIFFKEETLLETLEKFKGFVSYFEEKWTEMNKISSRQAGFIN